MKGWEYGVMMWVWLGKGMSYFSKVWRDEMEGHGMVENVVDDARGWAESKFQSLSGNGDELW